MSEEKETTINGIDVSESVLTATNNDVYYSQKAVDELQNVIKRLQEENEELKADLKGETEQCQKWYQLETDKHFLMLKYEQALEEIKEMILGFGNTPIEFKTLNIPLKEEDLKTNEGKIFDFYKKLKDKINEVLNGRD